MTYIFRREDTGETIEVDFETAMSQRDGYIQLPDGVLAKRCVYLEEADAEIIRKAPDGPTIPLKAEIVSDALGVTCNQVDKMRADAAKNGYSVEFTQDPHEPTFYQLRAPSWAERDRYARHRGYNDKNGLLGSGAALSAAQLEQAAARVKAENTLPLVDKEKPPGEDDH